MKRLAIILCLLFGQNALAQNLYSSEKIFLHTDRDLYLAGDTVWFKAYLMDAQSHVLSQNSAVAYVSLFNTDFKKINDAKLQMVNGQSFAQLILPRSLADGAYYLSAHSYLMQNFDDAFFFQKTIQVLNKSNTYQQVLQTRLKPAIQFFAEGGDLIENQKARIGFKITNQNGYGIDCEGYISNAAGEKIQEIKTNYLGIGSFSIMPEAGQKAFFNINNETIEANLPAIKAKGFTLFVDNVVKKDGIYMQVSNNVLDKKTLRLIAHQRGKILFENEFKIQKTSQNFFLKNELIQQDGIVHILLLDAANQPIAERLVFHHQHQNELKIEASLAQKNLQPRELITLNLQLNTQSEANVSVAIIDPDLMPISSQQNPNLHSYLLLNSDLKGQIELPNSYFQMEENLARFYLDNLMLTHGWSRFKWQELDNQKIDFAVEKSQIIAGKAFFNKKLIKNETIKFCFWNKTALKYASTTVDSAGHFELQTNWKDSVAVNAFDSKGHDLNLVFDDTFTPKLLPYKAPIEALINQKFELKEEAFMQRINAENALLLDEVVIKTSRYNALKFDSRRMMYQGEPDVTVEITKDMSASALSITQMLEGRIVGIRPGMLAEGMNEDRVMAPSTGVKDDPNTDNKPNDFIKSKITPKILILVDGVPTSSWALSSIDPRLVERVDLLRSVGTSAVFGIQGGEGKVINILLKKGGEMNDIFIKPVQSWQGFTTAKEFFEPKYALKQDKSTPDYRSTIYWNPNIKTDANGKASISFYNSDIAKKFQVVIEGIDEKGTFGSFNGVLD
jgi:hypothetical protein